MKICCWDRQGGCPQRPFVRLAEDFNGGESMAEDVTVPRDKLDQLAQALGVTYANWSDPESAIDELISAASGENGNGNGNGADDLEEVDAEEAAREMGGMAMSFGPPKRFPSRAAQERHTERTVAAFFSMLPGDRNRNHARR
jgi:hypothetical protein